ncbi:glycerophosphodiester phosphodiesterase family protein [Maritalea sp. S77]|uniref:glycerophosphodiester phosphodiesterase family protein n=1 Tax=Maritalea sp. S77 TaxID=3415125 RepID=UPI003C7A20DB
MKFSPALFGLALLAQPMAALADNHSEAAVHLGVRPLYLVDQMEASDLKDKLASCANGPFEKSDFSIGHRGAALQFPEHTKESYTAAARQGAGIIECDVAFTADKELVCRHSQSDLHTTTDILLRPELAAKCSVPFSPADPATGKKAEAKCSTSDITLAEYMTLNGKMDGANANATTVEEYVMGTAGFRTDLYATTGTLVTHKQSIELIKSLGGKFTPELKTPTVDMPYEGDFSQADYAQKMIDEYKAAGIDPKDVWAQSFLLDDVLYWIENEPEFGAQAVYLDGRYDNEGFDHLNPSTYGKSMQELADAGVKYIAPPLWVLVTTEDGKIVPSVYAKEAKAAGLNIITWTLERSGPLNNGGGWYFQSITDVTNNDGVAFELLDVLAKEVGVVGVFSDWPATTTYYANCMGL